MDLNTYIEVIEGLCNDLHKARKFQIDLAKKVLLANTSPFIKTIAGIDISYTATEAFVAAVVLNFSSGKILEEHTVRCSIPCPYIPTFLFLRELPPMLKIYKEISHVDCIIVDGHGLAHPYFAGLALMFGVITGKCTIGVAKSPLKGFRLCSTVKSSRYKQIFVNNKFVGVELKRANYAKPIFISPGNRITILESLHVVEKTLRKDKKLPSPLYFAHVLASDFKRHSTS